MSAPVPIAAAYEAVYAVGPVKEATGQRVTFNLPVVALLDGVAAVINPRGVLVAADDRSIHGDLLGIRERGTGL